MRMRRARPRLRDALSVFSLSLGFSIFALFAFALPADAHTINYQVEGKGISARLFYSSDDPASYSRYEIFGPGDPVPHQTGRTDKNGFLSFLPDRAGLWKVKVWGESTHGFHGATLDIQVDQALNLESFSKPLVATYVKLITGVSLIFGAFGIYALFMLRRKNRRNGEVKAPIHSLLLLSVLSVSLWLLLLPVRATAHHGGVSIGGGPGSPLEANSPLTLPQGGVLPSWRFEYVGFRKFNFVEPQNKDSFIFNSLGLSYGIRPYLTATLFLPYNLKRQDELGSPQGVGDLKCLANLGFHHDPHQGFGWNTPDDTAVTLEGTGRTYFGLSGGFSLPTGSSYKRLGGVIDRGMQPGFRSPTFSLGISATRQVAGSLSLIGDAAYEIFTRKNGFKFGNEGRLNLASVYELYGNPQRAVSKIDGILELNLLNIARDEEKDRGLDATGGTILYLSPGVRFSIYNANAGLLLKFPLLKNLNEKNQQQGSEGLEKIRVILTISFPF